MYYWSSYTINKGWIRNDANWEYHSFTHKGKHLTYEERCQIEALKAQERPLSNRKIAKQLDPAPQTIHIHIEVKNGTVRLILQQKQNGTRYEYETFIYSTSAGQAAYEKARQDSTKQPKWSAAPDFMAYADQQMKREKPSSDAVVWRAKKLKLFPPKKIPRTTTHYNYIYLYLMAGRNDKMFTHWNLEKTLTNHVGGIDSNPQVPR